MSERPPKCMPSTVDDTRRFIQGRCFRAYSAMTHAFPRDSPPRPAPSLSTILLGKANLTKFCGHKGHKPARRPGGASCSIFRGGKGWLASTIQSRCNRSPTNQLRAWSAGCFKDNSQHIVQCALYKLVHFWWMRLL